MEVAIAIIRVIIAAILLIGAIAVWRLEKGMREKRRIKPIKLKHSSLRRIGDSLFKSECPKCKKGILPVTRDPNTLKVIAEDYCLLCGQHFIYTDFERIADNGP